MDLRWAAYLGSGLLAAASLVPVSVYQPAEPVSRPTSVRRAEAAPAIELRMGEVERFTARLHAFATASPPPRTVRRNPFRFGHARVPVPGLGGEAAPSAVLTPAVPLPAEPVLALVGMAERQVGDTLVRTAIVSGFDDVHLVGVGDLIGNRYRVVAIGADAVELHDETRGIVLRLGLK